ncbi:MAG TPA: YqaA family protein [Dongiaceae bacterium]|jgi:membrane protein YqaA with SNARE-associated domain
MLRRFYDWLVALPRRLSATLRRLYDWIIALSQSPRAMPALAAVAFTESSFFPIPPDAMIIPMVLAQPKKAWRIATVATVASVIGGLFGYAIGFYLYETVGQWLIDLYGMQEGVDSFREQFNQYGFWIILVKGATPIPYKIVTIACGIAHYSLALFLIASIITRGGRFFIVAALLRIYGEPIRLFIERRLTLVTTAFVILIVVGFVALRYLP